MKIPPSLRPFLKAIVPAVGTLAAVIIQWSVYGTFDRQTLTIAITGLIASAIAYFVPNTPAPASPPPPAPPKSP